MLNNIDHWILNPSRTFVDNSDELTGLELMSRLVKSTNEVINSVNALPDTIASELTKMEQEGIFNDILDMGLLGGVQTTVRNTGKLIDILQDINTQILSNTTSGYRSIFPRGVIEITTPLIIPNNSDIDFNGATIKRKTGSGAYDLIQIGNVLVTTSNIIIKNLIVDGNYQGDNYTNSIPSQRYCGIRIVKGSNIKLEDVTVINTCSGEIQVDKNTSGLMIENSDNITLDKVGGYGNKGTCILLYYTNDSIIKNGLTFSNEGSGVSSYFAHRVKYQDLVSHDNSFSNVSVNGVGCQVNNIHTYNSGYSGLNLGHPGDCADDCIVNNVISYGNIYEGVTIMDSDNVNMTNIIVYENHRNNISFTDGSTNSNLNNITSKNSLGGQGIFYNSGGQHNLNNANVFNNFASGIYVNTGVSLKMGSNIKSYNNGQGVTSCSGVVLNGATKCVVGDIEVFDNQTTKTQDKGIWVVNSTNLIVRSPLCYGNITSQYQATGTNTYLVNPTNVTI